MMKDMLMCLSRTVSSSRYTRKYGCIDSLLFHNRKGLQIGGLIAGGVSIRPFTK
jgi:hypothetical protein